MFLPGSDDDEFISFRVEDHEVISSPIEHLVSRKLECRKKIAINGIRHMNISVIYKHIASTMKYTLEEIVDID